MECHVNDGHCTLCKDGFWGKNCNLLCHDQCHCCDAIFGNCVPKKCSGFTETSNAVKTIGKISYSRLSYFVG
jgi:hypothetical protein